MYKGSERDEVRKQSDLLVVAKVIGLTVSYITLLVVFSVSCEGLA